MRDDLQEIVEIGKEHSGKSETTSNYGNDWSKAKRLQMCGFKYGEHLNSSGHMTPERFFCRHAECDYCMTFRADILAKDTHGALGMTKSANPALVVRKKLISDNDGKVLDAFTKRIRYHKGLYKRLPLEHGVYVVITAIEDCFHPDKMTEVFGKELKPRLTDDMYHTFSDMLNIDFKEVATYCRLSGKRVTGNLRENATESENTHLMRYPVFIPKDASHMEKKQELDSELHNDVNAIPMNDSLEDNDELQSEIDEKRNYYRDKYLDAGIDFGIRAKFVHVPENEFEKWNTAAKVNKKLFSPDKALYNREKDYNALFGENVKFEGEAMLV